MVIGINILTWQLKKHSQRVNILKKFKFILDRKTLETIYITFIRPLLEYANVVWDTKTLILINKLENVQVEAARIVTGGNRFVSLSNLYTNACRSHTNIEQNDDFQIHKWKKPINYT